MRRGRECCSKCLFKSCANDGCSNYIMRDKNYDICYKCHVQQKTHDEKERKRLKKYLIDDMLSNREKKTAT